MSVKYYLEKLEEKDSEDWYNPHWVFKDSSVILEVIQTCYDYHKIKFPKEKFRIVKKSEEVIIEG